MKERLMCVLRLPHLGFFFYLTVISRRIIKLAKRGRVKFAAAAHLLLRALLYFLENIVYFHENALSNFKHKSILKVLLMKNEVGRN
jgi:hypothetical protein